MTVAICFAFTIAIALTALKDFQPLGIHKKRAVAISIGASLGLLIASNQPAMARPLPQNIALSHPIQIAALGAPDSAINQSQQALEEKLKVDPMGDNYKGIEYSSKTVRTQPDDQTILDAVKSQISDDIAVAVSNGSVRLSGMVQSRTAAKDLVEQIKETSGVHEVSFDLGLADTDAKTTR